MELSQMEKLEDYLFKLFTDNSKEYKESDDMGMDWFYQGMLASLEGDVDAAWTCFMMAANLNQVRASSLIEQGKNIPHAIIIWTHLAGWGDTINQDEVKEFRDNIPWYDQQFEKFEQLQGAHDMQGAHAVLTEMVEHGSYRAFIILKATQGYFR
jgi:hypothetical protein